MKMTNRMMTTKTGYETKQQPQKRMKNSRRKIYQKNRRKKKRQKQKQIQHQQQLTMYKQKILRQKRKHTKKRYCSLQLTTKNKDQHLLLHPNRSTINKIKTNKKKLLNKYHKMQLNYNNKYRTGQITNEQEQQEFIKKLVKQINWNDNTTNDM